MAQTTSLKKNFFFSSILTTANYIFPLLVFPYVSRVLGVTGIGICDFVDSIVNYFILLTMLGINTVGIRAISDSKNDKTKLNKAFSNLILLNTLTTLVGVIILIALTFTVDKFQPYKQFLFIGIFKLISTYLLAEWLYKGLEDFKYITLRTIFVKCIYVLLVFILVKDKDDATRYYLLTMMMIAVNAVVNMIRTRKYVSFTFQDIDLSIYLKPFLILGCYSILTSMYTTFNVTYLGWNTSNQQVGYYTTATKLFTILLSFFSAFTGVMLPRMTSLLAHEKIQEFYLYIKKSQNLLVSFSIPIIVYAIVFTEEIIFIIAGGGYEGAIIPMRIIVPLIFIIGYEQIIVIQVLNPLKKESVILRNSIIGACVGLILNLLLVQYLQSIGSALVWLCSEVTILMLAQRNASKYSKVVFPTSIIFRKTLNYAPVLIIFLWLKCFTNIGSLWLLMISGAILLFSILYIEYRAKNELIFQILNRIHK